MSRSAFAQPPSQMVLRNAASGHSDGKVIAGGYRIYPELAPAGLWTTPTDLARLLIDLQASANGRPSRLLSPGMTAAMLTPGKGNWGLGVELHGAGTARRFGHDGVNEGFQSTMFDYVRNGDGVVVMTNGGGRRLADEIVRAIAADYGWADLAGKPIAEAPLSQAALARLAGHYEAGGLSVDLTIRDGRLFGQTGGPSPEHLIALSPKRFETDVSGIVVEFQDAADGKVAGFRIVENGPPMTFTRSAPPVVDRFSSPIFVRGSMNDWGLSAPALKTADGDFVADLPLSVGDYQFKFGSADWKAADFGMIASTQIKGEVEALPLITHGGNIRVTISVPGTYRFELKATGAESAAFTLRKIG